MSGGEEVLQECGTTETLSDATRREMNILVAHKINKHKWVCFYIFKFMLSQTFFTNLSYSKDILCFMSFMMLH